MAHPILKSSVNKGNSESSEDEKEPLLSAVHTTQVNAEVHAAEVHDIQSSKIRDDTRNYDSQVSSDGTFETAVSSSVENVHSDTSSIKTVYETIEMDKNYDSTTTTEGRSTQSVLEFENMDEQYRKHSSVMQAFRSRFRYIYNFIVSKIRGNSEMQSTYGSSSGNFMATKQGLAENVESEDILSRPPTSNVGEHGGVKWSTDNSPPKSGDDKSTGSFSSAKEVLAENVESDDILSRPSTSKVYEHSGVKWPADNYPPKSGDEKSLGSAISFDWTTTSSSIEEAENKNSLGSNANEIMEIEDSESSSGNERIAPPISRPESPCHEQQTQVSRNESRKPKKMTILFSILRKPSCNVGCGLAAFIPIFCALAVVVPTVMNYYFDVSSDTCIAFAIIFLLCETVCCIILYLYVDNIADEMGEEREAKSSRKARYDRLLEKVDIRLAESDGP